MKLPDKTSISEDKIQKNRKNQEQNHKVEKMGISERRKLVHSLDIQGFSNQEISNKIKVSLSTVEKDLNEMRQSIRDWFSELGKEDRYLAFVDAVIQIDTVLKQLWKMVREEKDQKEKVKLLEKIIDSALKKTDLFKTSESYLTPYYFKKKDLSDSELIREMLTG